MSEVSKQNVPELRFPEFDGEWKAKCFSEIFEFLSGKNIKQNEASPNFDTPCVRYGELYHLYNEVIREVINKTNLPHHELLFSKGNEILLPSAGEDPMDIGSASALIIENVAIGRTINILRPKNENVYSQIYSAYYINFMLRKKISTLARGSSISNVYNSDLKKLFLVCPHFPEQQKIASFLSVVDEKIALLEKKKALLEDYKKGVMQKLFSQTLRFKDDDGNEFPDWEEKRFGYLGDFNGGGTPNTNINSYWDGKIPWISSSDIVDNEIKNVSITRYITEKAVIESAAKIIPKGSLLIVSRVGVGKLCISPIDLCTSQDFCNFTPKNLNSKYLGYLLIANKNTLLSLCQGTSIKGLTSKELKALKIPIPHKNEQQKIADFLSAIDTKITHTGEQLAQAKAFKKGLLQKMFV